ncbi:MAG: holin family protein [Oscillospiraceae bacterium]
MKWDKLLDCCAAAVGAVVGFLYGEVTGLFWAMIAFMAVDYATGVLVAVLNRNLSSETGFRGLVKKFLILVLVAMGHIIDTYVIGSGSALMSAVMLFFIANEGVSIVENAVGLGLPVPKKLREVLEQLKNESGGDNDDDN